MIFKTSKVWLDNTTRTFSDFSDFGQSVFKNYVNLVHWAFVFCWLYSFEDIGYFGNALILQIFQGVHFWLGSHCSVMMCMSLNTLWTQWSHTGDRSTKISVGHSLMLLTTVFTVDCRVLGNTHIGIFAIFHFESLNTIIILIDIYYEGRLHGKFIWSEKKVFQTSYILLFGCFYGKCLCVWWKDASFSSYRGWLSVKSIWSRYGLWKYCGKCSGTSFNGLLSVGKMVHFYFFSIFVCLSSFLKLLSSSFGHLWFSSYFFLCCPSVPSSRSS